MLSPTFITCPADRPTTIISNFGRGYPQDFVVNITRVDGEGAPSGTYREKRAFWIFPLPGKTGPLEPVMSFHRNWINAFYKVELVPDQAVVVTVG